MGNNPIIVTIQKIAVINSKYTYTINEFEDYYSSLVDVIPENSLKMIYQKLEPYIATPEELEKHRERIKGNITIKSLIY